MYQHEIKAINRSLKKTRKAIVSFGCSFVAGEGAVSVEILQNYNYIGRRGVHAEIKFTNQAEKDDFLKKYPLVTVHSDGSLHLRQLERENAFVNVLCKKYFSKEYTPINFGLSGNGNKASISQVNFLPNINWHLIKELIVVYIPTDPARIGFVNDQFQDHARFITMWPHHKAHKYSRGKLWDGYCESLYSEKFAFLEAINDVSHLRNWASNFNSKMIIFPAFNSYRKERFEEAILTQVRRHYKKTSLISNTVDNFSAKDRKIQQELIDKQWPWRNMWEPDGYTNWAHLVQCEYEDPTIDFHTYAGTGSPNYWFTSCMHPSSKAHDDLAQRLYNYITTELK